MNVRESLHLLTRSLGLGTEEPKESPDSKAAHAEHPPGRPSMKAKLTVLLSQLRRADYSVADKAVLVTQRVLSGVRLNEHLTVSRQVAYEVQAPPKVMRGLRDLVVRQGDLGDLDGICEVERTDPLLVRERFDRGDVVFVGQLGGQVLCHVWFHRGPHPFQEDQAIYASFELSRDCFWAYAAAATMEARASGVFVKVFQTALQDLFLNQGAQRVQCLVRHVNDRSVLLHERLGFRRVGVFTGVLVPGLKWLHWDGPMESRTWVMLRTSELLLPIPPVAGPMNQGMA